jgi:hypothetical protein
MRREDYLTGAQAQVDSSIQAVATELLLRQAAALLYRSFTANASFRPDLLSGNVPPERKRLLSIVWWANESLGLSRESV